MRQTDRISEPAVLRRLAALALILGSAAPIAGAAQSQAAASACAAPGATDRIEAVSAEGEIRLGALGPVRLADIRLPEGGAGARPLAWLRTLAGRSVRVAVGPPDRWQRRAATLALVDETTPVDIGELLIAEGFAVVDAGEEDALCRPALLALEALARAHRLGLWKADGGPLHPAGDIATLAGATGRFAIVEGRVFSVGERSTRTYLNFGRAGTGAFTVTIPKRTWLVLRRRGASAEGLRGSRIRARGLIEMWRAATMEVVAPDMLEILDDEPGLRR